MVVGILEALEASTCTSVAELFSTFEAEVVDGKPIPREKPSISEYRGLASARKASREANALQEGENAVTQASASGWVFNSCN